MPDCDFNIFVVYHISVEESEIAKSPAELWSKRKAEGVRRMKYYILINLTFNF